MADKVYDAIVVGSGATGGWAAKELCEAGMEVALLEAGVKLDPDKDYTEHARPWDMKYRNKQAEPDLEARRPIGARCYACEETNAHFFVDEVDNPWTTPPGKPFWWIRGRHVGGRTIMWGRQSYRFSDYDFKAASHDGFGEDWPISYDEIAPYYDTVERWIGVSGSKEGFDQLPDGQFLPPMAFTCGEEIMKKAVNAMGRGFTIGRCAVLTQNHRGRAACHYCGPCHRGCSTNSYFNAPGSTLPAAERTGKMTLITNAVVRHVTTNDKGLADGVFYFDSPSKQSREVKAKIVVLCASSLESTRILFNSANGKHPGGLGNSSGVMGHYLMDHMYAIGAFGTFPALGRKPEVANRPNGIYIPRFRNLHGDKQEKFIRGYGYQGGENATVWEHAYAMKGFGAEFKEAVRDGNASRASLLGFGEMLPQWDNQVTLDKEKVDAWGIPVLHIDCAHGDNEKAMAKDIVEQAAAMLKAAGAENITTSTVPAPPGFGIHECGTARMGNDPKKSVLNKWNQAHDVKNLFVLDGSAFPSIACQNPTLTMMALTVRACEYMAAEHKRGNFA
jgi:choline dehydrogenase-like flavoprotein